MELDATDLRLLEILQQDASLSNQALAERVHVSPATCLRRVKRLEGEEIIERRVAILSPEKLNTEIVLEGEKAGPHAMALNYASFEKIEGNEVIVKDNVSGELIHVHPKMVINAAGPWIDQVNKKAGIGTKYVGGTKGSHIIVNNPVLREAIG